MWLWMFPVWAAALAGCAAPLRRFEPVQDPNALDDAVFVHYLAAVPVVTVDEGYRAILLLADPAGHAVTFEERRAALETRGLIKPSWRMQPDQILDKGTLAYMLRRLCHIDPGLNEGLAGLTRIGERRYALRSCVAARLLPPGRPQDYVNGGELAAALARADEWVTPPARPPAESPEPAVEEAAPAPAAGMEHTTAP
ncbi:MAG TPA: hypothetical protein PKK06_02985 [Phycisphaerae bacterium]|nr:hypothetical protein [Phycisphaerae bacterium]HNU44651.1 hypothetical protein [Phycisphaerae bacterium]